MTGGPIREGFGDITPKDSEGLYYAAWEIVLRRCGMRALDHQMASLTFFPVGAGRIEPVRPISAVHNWAAFTGITSAKGRRSRPEIPGGQTQACSPLLRNNDGENR